MLLVAEHEAGCTTFLPAPHVACFTCFATCGFFCNVPPRKTETDPANVAASWRIVLPCGRVRDALCRLTFWNVLDESHRRLSHHREYLEHCSSAQVSPECGFTKTHGNTTTMPRDVVVAHCLKRVVPSQFHASRLDAVCGGLPPAPVPSRGSRP